MLLIQKIGQEPWQQQNILLPDGTSFTMEIYFRPMQQGWFFNSIIYNTFILNGMRICNSPNMLYQFQNQIPFGLACFSVNNREPSLIEDFFSSVSQLYVLTQEEVSAYTGFIRNGTI